MKNNTPISNPAKSTRIRPVSPQEEWRKMLIDVTAIFLVTHIGIYLLAMTGNYVFEGELPADNYLWMGIKPSSEFFLRVWERWDSIHYLSILEHGYTQFKPGILNTAFFPLYPLLGYLVNGIIGNPTISLLLVSNCASWGALVYIYKLVALEHGQESARRTVLYVSIFPYAFILVGMYTESLFLLNLAATLYYARTGRWWTAAVWGALLTATRLVGVAVIPALLWEYMSQREWNWKRIDWKVLSLATMLAGLVGYMLYTSFVFGDFFSLVHSSTAGWDRHAAWPWQAWEKPINLLKDSTGHPMVLFNIFFTVFGLVLAALSVGRLRAVYVILAVELLIIPLSSNQAGGIPRYVLTNLPLFILLSEFGRHRIFHLATSVFFLLYLAVFTMLHAIWFWVG